MNKQRLAHIVHRYCKQLDKHSKKIRKGFDEDAIHQFRVNVKKLRAFLRMMRLKAGDPGQLRYTHSFKDMYATIGMIRDRQLGIKKLRKSDREHTHEIVGKLKKEVERLKEDKDDFPGKRSIEDMEQKLTSHLPLMPAMLVREFVEQKLRGIGEITSKGTYSDPEMHTIRKNLKDIYYIVGIYHDDLKIKLPFRFWNEQEMKEAEELANMLGQFNDTAIALSFLPLSAIRHADDKDRKGLRKVRRQWLTEKRGLKKNALKNLSRPQFSDKGGQTGNR